MAVRLINIEHGYPKVEEAIKKLKFELSTLRRTKVRTVKVIHGYGSSGTGGSIRQATRRYLSEQQQSGRIKAFCAGESFGPFEATGRKMLELDPGLRKDPDWDRQNDGITIVLLR
ncbi:MAG: Smr/MutS family protein [Saccharofermentanales bacterium]|nr:hypothetical protein [Clostridiaceae bacterium]